MAAAMVLASPGHIGMLFASPLDAPGVEADVLARVVRAVSLEALAGGELFVQSLAEPDAVERISMLAAAGFECLAELIYLKLDLGATPASTGRSDLVWRSYGLFDEDELGRVIAETYEGSLDCPGLVGVRTMADVIAAHKAGGHFRPDSWWVVHLAADSGKGPAAGCILVNDANPLAAELVYMGVVPRRRGRGIGAAMVQGAAERVRTRGIKMLTAAVDAGNAYARRIYDRLGFVETQRRLAYMIAAKNKEPSARIEAGD